ncbi:hypothetical protein [Mycolicibacterium frederiksbergense]|uniref:hypothetical protein n=1 Tax=Mycolicibacterium frederiksbergense TaxID=117567 RepID=UPI00399A33AE
MGANPGLKNLVRHPNRKGLDARNNVYATDSKRCADVYVFCLLEGEDRERIDPLEVVQWTSYVLPTIELDRQVPEQKTIGLGRLKALFPHKCSYGELAAAIHDAARINRGS